MSKLSFRARAIDANKPMPLFKGDEIPELLDFAAVNRAVMEMPTGMEKEEETEHHLQRALSAQQVYGTAEALVIPIPEMDMVGERYYKLYGTKSDFRMPKQYIHVQPFGMDQEIPEYDMDSEDEVWLNKQVKHLKMDVPPIKFESMMDRLEKGSGQMVVTLHEAKALLKVDDDLIIAVYDYWLNKRLRLQHPLIPLVKTEKRDGTTTNNPYVAFRRRTEKMQTRKNRKNDEVSYEKMLKLRKDLNKALIILELLKRREKSKKELLKLTIEVAEKRYQMQDWEGKLLAEANAKKHTLPSFFPIPHRYPVSREWEPSGVGAKQMEPGALPRKKREYKKRKHKQSVMPTVTPAPLAAVRLPNYVDVNVVLHRGRAVSSDDDFSGASQSDHETESDPDGVFAFRRMAGCSYVAPRCSDQGSWPWTPNEDDSVGNSHYRYSLASLPAHVRGPSSSGIPRPAASQRQRCAGFIRRRVGRGGRVLLDRGFSEWDDQLADMDLDNLEEPSDQSCDYLRHIRHNGIPLYRTKPSYGYGSQSSSAVVDKMSVTLSPLRTRLTNNEKLQEENGLLQHVEHLEFCRNSTAMDQVLESLTGADVSAKVLDSKLSAVVSLFSDNDLASNSFLCRYSASMADVNGVGTGPVAVKPCSIAKFIMPNVNSSLACNDRLSSVAALPTVDGCASSPYASYTFAGPSDNSTHLTVSNSVNNSAVNLHSLTMSRLSDNSNTRIIDGHFTSSDGNRSVASLANHSSSVCRESNVTSFRPPSLSFVSTPSLKLSAGVQINHKDNVSRENHDGVSTTDQTAFVMEVT